jgi:thioredoxin reductase (NADPH)
LIVGSQTHIRDVIIIGSGPAGLTAAIYTARANLRPLVIEGEPSSTSDQPGGQLMLTTEVENYPGFVEGIMGPDLMGRFRAQAERFGAEYLTEKATRVDLSERPFRVWTTGHDGNEVEHRAHTVIVATGARALMLELESESRLLGHGVSTCATCDGFFFRGQHIAVVGGGDSAVEEAIFLTKFAETVTLIHRRKELRASKILQDRAFKNPKIRFQWDSVVTDVLGDTKVEGVRIRNVLTDEESVLEVSGLFVAIGHVPNTDLLRGQLKLDANGYLHTHSGSLTDVEGVFACGDAQDHVYRQAITAAGSGCMAAIDAERWLEAHAEAPADIAETSSNW